MSIKKNLVYNVALQGLNVLFPLITAPYISRVLGVENVGIVSFITTYTGYFVIFAMFGVGNYGIREIAKVGIQDKEKINQLFSELFKISLISTFIVSIIYINSIFFIPEIRAYKWLYIIGGVSIYLVPISIDWYFQGQENFRLITIRSAVIKTLSFIGLFVFVRERDDLLSYILLSSFAIVGNQVWNIIYAKKKGLKIKIKRLIVKKHLYSISIFFFSNLSIIVFAMLDVLMLGFLSTYEQVGLFTSPNKVIIVISSMFIAFNTILLPRLANNQQYNKDINSLLLQKAFDSITLIVIPMAIGLCLCSSRFVPLFFGSEFVGSIIPMQILSLKIILATFNNFLVANILIVWGYERQFLIIAGVMAVVSFILNWIFIPQLGAIGATATTIIVEAIAIILNLYIIYKLTSIRIKWIGIMKTIVCILPIILIYFLMCTYMMTISSLWFLGIFICSSLIIYLLLQRYLFHNYIIIEGITTIKKFYN